MAIQEANQSVEELCKKLENRGTGIKANPYKIKRSECVEMTPIASMKKGKHRPKLTLADKVSIIHKIIHQLQPVKEVA